MKKIILSLVAIAAVALSSFGQAPEGFKYQAVVRDGGNLILNNQAVGMRMTIQQGSIGGATVYSETFAPTTNAYGLVNLEIGNGIVTSGTFATIDWANGPFFIETAVDVTGGINYVVMGTSQLMSVPYALYAKTSGSSTPGPQGPAGTNGTNGATGPMGPQGPAGLNGADGNDGLDGATGPMGPQGSAGLNGADGNDGLDGATGPMGPQGPAGLNGADGNDGLDGATGPMGPQGPAGLNGADGNDGLDGANGPMGPQGPAGNDGLDGATGLMGPQGPAGLNGADGNDGLDGATGPMGPQGPAGLNGAAGNDGLDGATGPMGPQGPAGLNGADGNDGLDGATGPMGPQGPAGLNGTDGNDGLDGATGPMGPQGPAGLIGLDGATGPQGPIGATGLSAPLFGNILFSYGTAAIATTTTWQNIPGLLVTVTVPAGMTAKVLLHAETGLFTNCATNNAVSGTDIGIYRNGVLLTNGGFKRVYLGDALIDLDENNLYGNPSFEAIEVLTAGTYVYDLRCWQQLTGSCNATVGGASGDIRQGLLSAQIIFQ